MAGLDVDERSCPLLPVLMLTTVELHLPGLNGKASHPDKQKIRIIGVFFENTRSVNKVMRLIQYNSVLTFKLQIEFVPFKIVPLGGYTPPETLFPLFVATLVVANWNRF